MSWSSAPLSPGRAPGSVAAAGTSPDLANLPSRPATSTPAQQQAAAQSLAADGAQARYSADALRAGTEAAAAPPAAADVPPSAQLALNAPPSAAPMSANDAPPTTDAPPSAQGSAAQAPRTASSAALAQGTAAVPTSGAPAPSQVRTAALPPTGAAIPPGAEDVFLALRGLRTMDLRLREAERQAVAMARWLQALPEVLRVIHPALPEYSGHEIWKRDFLGSSGLFSVVLQPASAEAVAAFIDSLELFGLGASWGGYESLIMPFDCTKYRTATTWAPGGPTVRLSIGLEDLTDLQEDLDRGFAAFRALL